MNHLISFENPTATKQLSNWTILPIDRFEEKGPVRAVLQRVHQVRRQDDKVLNLSRSSLARLSRLTCQRQEFSFDVVFDRFSRKIFEVKRQVVRLSKVRRIIPISSPGFLLGSEFFATDLKERKHRWHVDVRKDKVDFSCFRLESLILGDVFQDTRDSGLKLIKLISLCLQFRRVACKLNRLGIVDWTYNLIIKICIKVNVRYLTSISEVTWWMNP